MEEQTHPSTVNVADELARKDAQLERLRSAYMQLQEQLQQKQQQQAQQQPQENAASNLVLQQQIEHIYRNISHLPTFTGVGQVTINSFMSNVEYLLSTIRDETMKREAIKAIYYRNIQGEAKNTIINVQQVDNWQLIKKLLKLRYRPDTEPHQIYKKINNLCVRTVSELAIEIQNIKYKSDELVIYHSDDHGIDLSNIDSIIVNTIKEMSQGTLLDKIYDMRDLGSILDIMTRRRYEDSCIRPEYRKFKVNKYNNANMNYNRNQNEIQSYFNNRPSNYNNNFSKYKNRYDNNYMNRNFNSGHFKVPNNTSGNFQRPPQVGNPRANSGHYRWSQTGQNRSEPMEIDNIEVNHFQRIPQMGNPRPNVSQNRLTQPGQYLRETMEHYEKDNNVGENQNYENIFFRKQPQTTYPS